MFYVKQIFKTVKKKLRLENGTTKNVLFFGCDDNDCKLKRKEKQRA